MNSFEKPSLPGYVVTAKDLSNPNRFKPCKFGNVHLLTARQSAFQYAQKLLSEKQSHEVFDIAIDLVEYQRSQIPNPCTVIATVFQQEESQSQPTSMGLDALWNSLEGLDRERDYYQTHGYGTGFGCVEMNQIMERNLLAQTKDLSSLSTPFYKVLYDGFTYAASLVSHFNNRAKDDDVLCFCTDFMPNH